MQDNKYFNVASQSFKSAADIWEEVWDQMRFMLVYVYEPSLMVYDLLFISEKYAFVRQLVLVSHQM